jgi:hypothetical protein
LPFQIDQPGAGMLAEKASEFRKMNRVLENRFYYLDNFQRVLDWIGERYRDLLIAEEQEFIERFGSLPASSRALLVRMVMRKGDLFRASKLQYEEIGCTRQGAGPLADAGWIDYRPLLTLEQLFGLLRKPEISQIFGPSLRNKAARKDEQLEALRDQFSEARHFLDWCPHADDCVYQLKIGSLCDRFRLMFFGNLHQDWTEFVLSDLGIFKYEKVQFSAASRGFRTRTDVDDYLHLHHCRERFQLGEPADEIMKLIPAGVLENDWLESRRGRILFEIAQHYERTDELRTALDIYSACGHPGSRIRAIRVLERSDEFQAAFDLATAAESGPESEAERQQLARILPRLRRKLGLPKLPSGAAATVPRVDLILPVPEADFFVEGVVVDHLAEPHAPVHYVENTLINSLFGLLCWNAIFAAVPGAFFHPFHTGPVDLHNADFHRRRQREFDVCLSQLDTDEYLHTINRNFREKAGIQSPFVFWEILSRALLDLALTCIPASHLKKWFERILLDIQSNRAGFPDLIQFWPQEKRYRMIEVKGPGDRLQDNQIRLLDYCMTHEMPVSVCYVRWSEDCE